MKKSQPNYAKIYSDLIRLKYPEKEALCKKILLKREELSIIDVIKLNLIISPNNPYNQKYKSYDKETILHILDYQKKNNLTNAQVACHFKMSRNTISKWKKKFQ